MPRPVCPSTVRSAFLEHARGRVRLVGSSKGVRSPVKKLISPATVVLFAACLLGPRVAISQEKPQTAAAAVELLASLQK